MTNDDFIREAAKQYSDLVAMNSEGGLTPLVYKLDNAMATSLLIKTFVEADMTAQTLLEEYEKTKPDMPQSQKEALWERFSFSNQVAGLLKMIIEESKDVILTLPEAMRRNPENIDDYVAGKGIENPEDLRKAIERLLDDLES